MQLFICTVCTFCTSLVVQVMDLGKLVQVGSLGVIRYFLLWLTIHRCVYPGRFIIARFVFVM